MVSNSKLSVFSSEGNPFELILRNYFSDARENMSILDSKCTLSVIPLHKNGNDNQCINFGNEWVPISLILFVPLDKSNINPVYVPL